MGAKWCSVPSRLSSDFGRRGLRMFLRSNTLSHASKLSSSGFGSMSSFPHSTCSRTSTGCRGDSVQDIEGKDITNLACDVFAVGVECDSISSLSKQMTEGFDCLGEVSGQPSKTGDTARSAMAFLHRRRPPIAIIENVKNLACVGKSGQSNLNWLVQSANRLGYYVVDMVLGASSFGVPQQRERVYMVFVFVDDFADQTQGDAPNWALELKSFIKAMQIESFGLHEFLNQDSDPDVVIANEQLPAKESNKGRTKQERKRQAEDSEEADEASMPLKHVQNIEVEHLDAYSQHKLAWPPAFPQSFLAKRACLPLSDTDVRDSL